MSAAPARVSVVIPAYNSAATVRQAVDSALKQTMPDIEIIVVDDASSDETATLVEAIRDPRVTVVRRDQNGGSSRARNSGIALARGEWIGFLDADDIWLPNKLEIQLEKMLATPGCLASQGSAYFVDQNLKPLQLRLCHPVSDPLLTFLRFQNLPNAASSWLIKRELLDRIGVFDTSLALHEDWDLTLRLTPHANPICIEEPLTMYRLHEGNQSHDIDNHVASGLAILNRVFSDPELPADVTAHKREIYARYYTMLCGGMLRVGRWRGCAYWGLRALLTEPRMLLYMAAMPVRRITRRAAARANPLPRP